jgi:hypothetical protein
MTVDELRTLARAVEPPLEVAGDVDGHELVLEYNGLIFGFLERVVRARNSVVLGQAVDPQLEQELRHLARELPGKRRTAEAAAQAARPVSPHAGSARPGFSGWGVYVRGSTT